MRAKTLLFGAGTGMIVVVRKVVGSDVAEVAPTYEGRMELISVGAVPKTRPVRSPEAAAKLVPRTKTVPSPLLALVLVAVSAVVSPGPPVAGWTRVSVPP